MKEKESFRFRGALVVQEPITNISTTHNDFNVEFLKFLSEKRTKGSNDIMKELEEREGEEQALK